ncbi:DUF6790 family protein [Synechococcus sp. MIT S9509]|uniref:DUF6790 family protein n=1 Tax=Synechococcus sp. MIT S9509 TaxID=1801630 RepID=UPI00082E2C83
MPWIAFWVLGVGGVSGFIMHLVFGSFLAEQVVWPVVLFSTKWPTPISRSDSRFQQLPVSQNDDLLASMVASASWVFADETGDVVSLVADQNKAPSNACTGLYGDLLTPLLALLLV